MSAPAIAIPGSVQRGTQPAPLQTEILSPQQQDVAHLAYALWQQRGCPTGSAEIDWLEAEQQLSR